MNYPMSDDERALVAQIERFSHEVLAPKAAQIDEEALFATCHLDAMAEMGLLGLNLPEEHGGIGLSGPALYAGVEAI
ncbi:acyl-CoA dehydrogenase family protein, partial [uncultured Roseovarius sp.]|uniref:acyl-CoA dehydrogenase family protein n=1 Tax=uncultured Roseovarius sp. TaxID=293344 RepID=UPI0025FA6A06